MEQYAKRGYLNSEFRLFHLTDRETHEVEYHYHDFDKITIFIKGKVTYMVEGKSYDEIANALGVSIGTIKSRLSRARQQLKKILEQNKEPYRSFFRHNNR